MAGQERELIPRKTLFGNPERAQVTISPDGKQIAYLSLTCSHYPYHTSGLVRLAATRRQVRRSWESDE